ncbi:hypothetical protein, partial [Xanthomonas hortorum]|uniref:hypothetical protein n=1 Tax=Xanthomonas hortorum TaxID=56454 RepID=UPI001C3DFC4A
MKLETVPKGLMRQHLMPFRRRKTFDDYVDQKLEIRFALECLPSADNHVRTAEIQALTGGPRRLSTPKLPDSEQIRLLRGIHAA